MKIRLILLSALLLVLGFATHPNEAPAATTEEEIRSLEQKWNDAYAKNDLPAYFAYYTPDFVQWLPEGRTDIEKYKKDWTAYINAGNKIQSVELRDIAVRISPGDDAAAVSYILYVKTKLADGKITEEENQETDVWFKRQGEWKVVALHYSPAPKK